MKKYLSIGLFKNKKKRNNPLISKKYKLERTVRYRNPLRITKSLFKFKLFRVINIILLIAILGGLYFFLFSNFYDITNIEIQGNQIISTDDLLDITNDFLANNRFFILKNRNIFLFNRNSLKKKINQVILLDDLKIEKILPNTIRLTLKEKEAALKWLTDNQEYLIDKQGIIIKRFYKLSTPKIFQIAQPENPPQELEQENVIKVTNSASQSVNLGDQVLKSEDIDFILNLIKEAEKIDYLKISNISVPNIFPQYLLIDAESGWKIYFNLSDSLKNQLNRLDILISEKIKKENLSAVDYIDLRLGESVYYKMK